MANEIYENSWWGSPTSTGWGSIYYEYAVIFPSEVTTRFSDRVIADGGVVESLDCIDRNIDLKSDNWTYYFRVTDDGGIVESLECVTI